MLREQVRISNIFNIINQLFLRNVIIPALKRTVYSFVGKENEREVISIESRQGEKRRSENRKSSIYHLFPFPSSLDTVRNRCFDRGIRQSVIIAFPWKS